MIDRENVIKGLTACTDSTPAEDCRKCPYQGKEYCTDSVMRDALTLLEEQEPVKPIVHTTHTRTFGGSKVTLKMSCCGGCGMPIEDATDTTPGWICCPNCGRRINWNA